MYVTGDGFIVLLIGMFTIVVMLIALIVPKKDK
jgi:hypothetical protein